MPTDKGLMAAYVDGEASAFRTIFDRWADRLRRFMIRAGVPAEDAPD